MTFKTDTGYTAIAKFQFLIGKIMTEIDNTRTMHDNRFQFLIGKIMTRIAE